jgi:hypothetical protein
MPPAMDNCVKMKVINRNTRTQNTKQKREKAGKRQHTGETGDRRLDKLAYTVTILLYKAFHLFTYRFQQS